MTGADWSIALAYAAAALTMAAALHSSSALYAASLLTISTFTAHRTAPCTARPHPSQRLLPPPCRPRRSRSSWPSSKWRLRRPLHPRPRAPSPPKRPARRPSRTWTPSRSSRSSRPSRSSSPPKHPAPSAAPTRPSCRHRRRPPARGPALRRPRPPAPDAPARKRHSPQGSRERAHAPSTRASPLPKRSLRSQHQSRSSNRADGAGAASALAVCCRQPLQPPMLRGSAPKPHTKICRRTKRHSGGQSKCEAFERTSTSMHCAV